MPSADWRKSMALPGEGFKGRVSGFQIEGKLRFPRGRERDQALRKW